VAVSHEQQLDVAEPEAELLDVGAYAGHRVVDAGVDQDVALARGDEVDGKVISAHVIQVSLAVSLIRAASRLRALARSRLATVAKV